MYYWDKLFTLTHLYGSLSWGYSVLHPLWKGANSLRSICYQMDIIGMQESKPKVRKVIFPPKIMATNTHVPRVSIHLKCYKNKITLCLEKLLYGHIWLSLRLLVISLYVLSVTVLLREYAPPPPPLPAVFFYYPRWCFCFNSFFVCASVVSYKNFVLPLIYWFLGRVCVLFVNYNTLLFF